MTRKPALAKYDGPIGLPDGQDETRLAGHRETHERRERDATRPHTLIEALAGRLRPA